MRGRESVFSKSVVELDNGATITSEDNALNGILLEDSTFNMFNMPQFAGPRLPAPRKDCYAC